MSIHFYSYRRKYRCAHRLQMGKISIFLGNMDAQTETVQLTESGPFLIQGLECGASAFCC